MPHAAAKCCAEWSCAADLVAVAAEPLSSSSSPFSLGARLSPLPPLLLPLLLLPLLLLPLLLLPPLLLPLLLLPLLLLPPLLLPLQLLPPPLLLFLLILMLSMLLPLLLLYSSPGCLAGSWDAKRNALGPLALLLLGWPTVSTCALPPGQAGRPWKAAGRPWKATAAAEAAKKGATEGAATGHGPKQAGMLPPTNGVRVQLGARAWLQPLIEVLNPSTSRMKTSGKSAP
jgi:hypothetical protein